jgi:hypothetical protein
MALRPGADIGHVQRLSDLHPLPGRGSDLRASNRMTCDRGVPGPSWAPREVAAGSPARLSHSPASTNAMPSSCVPARLAEEPWRDTFWRGWRCSRGHARSRSEVTTGRASAGRRFGRRRATHPRLKRVTPARLPLRGATGNPPSAAGPPSKCLQLPRVRLTRTASPSSIRSPTSTPRLSPRCPRLANRRS